MKESVSPASNENIINNVPLSTAESVGSAALIGSELNPVPGVSHEEQPTRIEPGQRVPVEMPSDPSGALGYNIPVIRR